LNLADKVKIDADQLTEARLSEDAARVHLTLLDQDGQRISLSLPVDCLNTIITALPGRADPGTIHKLDTWNMGTAGNGQDLLLTLRTPQGLAISFTLKPWQVEGMATIATYGSAARSSMKTVH
jgi:hypothetical protein